MDSDNNNETNENNHSSDSPVEKDIREALTKVIDPEIGVDIINLGLIYKIDFQDDGHAEIDMTLTSMGCPIGPQFQMMVKSAAESVKGVKSANVNLVFSPPWDPNSMASDDAKIMLGIF